jgi:calcineurin-like phosphoesterase family protein
MKIVLEKGQRIFFTSDSHYGHSNICRATTKWNDDNLTRDYKSLDHMNDVLVNNINEVVGENDILIHLGDWSFGGFDNIGEFRNRILCKNVYLVYGNHDHHIRRNKEDVKKLFSGCFDYLHLDLRVPNGSLMDKISIVCLHYPIASWDGLSDGVIHLHGHVHLPPHLKIADGRAMDVGVDGNNLYPYELSEIRSLLKDRPKVKLTLPKDHHEKNL